jgi:hypothetical protein
MGKSLKKILGDLQIGRIHPDSLWTQLGTILEAMLLAPLPLLDLDLVMTRSVAKIGGLTAWVACYLLPFWHPII